MATILCIILYVLGAVVSAAAIVEAKPSRTGLLFVATFWPFLVAGVVVLQVIGVEYKDKK